MHGPQKKFGPTVDGANLRISPKEQVEWVDYRQHEAATKRVLTKWGSTKRKKQNGVGCKELSLALWLMFMTECNQLLISASIKDSWPEAREGSPDLPI